MDFGMVLAAIKAGKRVARAGWVEKGIFIFLVPGSKFKVSRPPLLGIYPEGTEIIYRPHIDIRTAAGTIGPWQPNQADIMATDWMIVEE